MEWVVRVRVRGEGARGVGGASPHLAADRR